MTDYKDDYQRHLKGTAVFNKLQSISKCTTQAEELINLEGMLLSKALDLIGTDEVAKAKFYRFYCNLSPNWLERDLSNYIERELK